ncbi:MAG: IS481 family transposase [Chloroflexota bacterium]
MGRYLVEAHLREGRSVAELAAMHDVHRSWLYKLLARFKALGDAGLEPRSRRPRRSPAAMAQALAEEIVAMRQNLLDQGLDAGALTIHWHLARRHGAVPSVSSIWRVLRRRGLVTPAPRKRPRSSLIRFQADLPNECWQSDMTHWALAGGRGAEVVNFIDDHSRLCLASVALPVTTAVDVGQIFQAARARHGTPASVLTDNGCIFTASHRGGKVVLETELERLGVRHKRSRPYHPQTCGKVERFHQTLKKYLAKQPAAGSLEALQAQLDRFATYYNEERPHRALGRQTPREVYDAKVKATPSAKVETHFRIRHDKVDRHGKLSLRYDSRLLHIGVGARHKGLPVVMLIADRDVRVVSAADGELLRHLTLDPSRDYQRQSA